MPKPSHASTFQLLEVNLISAQDLPAASTSMRVFAVAWINPKRKLTTRVDNNGHTNPTWNEKFVFRVDEDFLKDETSKIMIEIYVSAWLRDILIGTAAIVVNNIENSSKMRFVAIQLRRPSGRPQGILNTGLVVLDSSMRSMPLCSELSTSAIGYHDIMDAKSNKKKSSNNGSKVEGKIHALYRSKSERSTSDYGFSKSNPASSICSATINNHSKKGPGSICIESSIVDGSEVSDATRDNDTTTSPKKEEASKKGGTPENNVTKNVTNPNGHGNGSVVTMSLCSDVGPSPSVVAAAIAKGIYPLPRGANTETENSLMDEWADEDSVEGLNTKIERWRTELPPMYDETGKSSEHHENMRVMATLTHPKMMRQKKKGRSRSSGGSLFSCFGLGYEISITCGGKGSKPKKRRSDLAYDDDSYL